ncbi:anti-sigma B factor antagonist [Saccharicrinis carchari]|uniref:Anti-sigma factor antagonist n=1 Tax=Saccharicrinis carchari TaxID=1168039 RepID=A0A521B625_SACCC|nr:STAS domain-containing protein [Saccharicrinis carchari]SMO42539.1 anti-sigma B factor antagonist [Saccharicrinis carchari]
MIETRMNNGIVVAGIKDSDRLTAAVADDVKRVLTKIISESNSKVVLNLSNIQFIDSSGFGVLISALKTARQKDVPFVLCCIHKDVMSLLTLMKLDKVFEICEDESILE